MEIPILMAVPVSSLARLSDVLRMPVLADDLPRDEKRYLFWLDTVDGPGSLAASLKDYGIQLVFGSFDVPFLVVDSINKEPAEN